MFQYTKNVINQKEDFIVKHYFKVSAVVRVRPEINLYQKTN